MKIVTMFQCEFCKALHDNRDDATQCESGADKEPVLKVGDIVTGRSGFGWFDGDLLWVSNPGVYENKDRPTDHGNCFGACCTFDFYYVVTAVDRGEDFHHYAKGHQIIYHLETEAMSGDQGYRSGYTCRAHIEMTVVPDPPTAVVEASKKLIGHKASTSV